MWDGLTVNTYRSERPAKRRRPTRRSMAEFAALLESGAVVEKLTSRQAIIDGTNKAQGAAASVPENKNLNYSGPEDDRTSQQLDEVTLAAAKSDRDYRTRILENLKVNIAAAPDCAHGLTSANLASRLCRQGGRPNARRGRRQRHARTAAPVSHTSSRGLSRQGDRTDQCQREHHPRLCVAARQCDIGGRVDRTVDQPRAQALPTDHETCGRIHDVDAHVADERMTASVARPVVQLFWTLGKVVVVRREARRVGRPAPHGISARN